MYHTFLRSLSHALIYSKTYNILGPGQSTKESTCQVICGGDYYELFVRNKTPQERAEYMRQEMVKLAKSVSTCTKIEHYSNWSILAMWHMIKYWWI